MRNISSFTFIYSLAEINLATESGNSCKLRLLIYDNVVMIIRYHAFAQSALSAVL